MAAEEALVRARRADHLELGALPHVGDDALQRLQSRPGKDAARWGSWEAGGVRGMGRMQRGRGGGTLAVRS